MTLRAGPSRAAGRAPTSGRLDYSPSEPFTPAAGLASRHLQTLFGALFRAGQPVPLRRERWEMPDGDFLDVDWLDAPPGAPRLLVLHGLEGSSRSGYVLATLAEARARGWGAAALNFRSCSGEPNRLLRSYHARETADVHFALERVRARSAGPLFAVGFSIGGGTLAWALAEAGEGAPVRAAAGVCVPFDVARSSALMDGSGPLRFLYRRWFFSTIKAKAAHKARAFPGSVDLPRVLSARTFRDLDDAFVAPIHGFAGAADFYRCASSGPALGQIRQPTLFIAALDDPFVPADSLPRDGGDNPHLYWLVTPRGGHLGYVAGSALRPRFWAERQVMEFFSRHL